MSDYFYSLEMIMQRNYFLQFTFVPMLQKYESNLVLLANEENQ